MKVYLNDGKKVDLLAEAGSRLIVEFDDGQIVRLWKGDNGRLRIANDMWLGVFPRGANMIEVEARG